MYPIDILIGYILFIAVTIHAESSVLVIQNEISVVIPQKTFRIEQISEKMTIYVYSAI